MILPITQQKILFITQHHHIQHFAKEGAGFNQELTFLYAKACTVSSGDGVEDIRLEAKAKDTKKIRSQGQPFRGQTLSSPRTGMLEAKDQEHIRQCSPKKRSSKIFSGDLKKKGLKNFFLAIYKNSTIQKTLLSSSRGQGNFRGPETLRPRSRT